MSDSPLTDALVAFAASGWAFRAPLRAYGRALVGARLPDGAVRAVAFAAAPLRGAAEIARLACGAGDVTTPAVSAALALGAHVDLPGAALIDAAIAGAEVALRVAAALGPDHLERGWDPIGSAGRLGAAVAAARVLALPRGAFRDALGIAATAAGGLQGGRSQRSFLTSAAAADGVEAALLARAGFTAAPRALEGRRGLAALMTASFDPALGIAGLGEHVLLAEPVALDRSAQALAAGADLERAPSLRALVTRPIETADRLID